MQHRSFLEYRGFRYLKVSLLLCGLAIAAYIWHRIYHFQSPGAVGYGGSAMGYALGTVAALLVLWLTWLGVRKRQYKAARTTLQGWLSAHVYLGLSTVVIATLHSGFEMGVNLHTLVYGLLLIVVVSGTYGVVIFARLPVRMTTAMGEDSVESLLLQIQEIDQHAQRVAVQMPETFNTLVSEAIHKTRLRETWLQSLVWPMKKHCATAGAVAQIQTHSKPLKDEVARQGRELFGLMLTRQSCVKRVRYELQSRAQLRRWLSVHVPISIALLAGLTAHVVSVFMYW